MTALPLIAIVFGILSYFVFPGRLLDFLGVIAHRVVGLEKKTIAIDGIQWTYLEGRRSDAETMVLVHGFGADKDNWLPWAWYLRKHVHLICPDLPGFGESAMDPESDYSTSAQADRLNRFLGAIGVGRCHLVGNSMGGMIALRFALVNPTSLATMTLIDAAGVTPHHKNPFELGVDRGERQLLARQLEDIDRLLKLTMHNPPPAPRRFKQVYLQRAKEREAHLEAVFDILDVERHAALDDQLGRIHTPTLIIWGRQDQILDVSSATALSAGLPNNRCEILEETGHVPMIERPKATAQMQLEFLRDVKAGQLDGAKGPRLEASRDVSSELGERVRKKVAEP